MSMGNQPVSAGSLLPSLLAKSFLLPGANLLAKTS